MMSLSIAQNILGGQGVGPVLEMRSDVDPCLAAPTSSSGDGPVYKEAVNVGQGS